MDRIAGIPVIASRSLTVPADYEVERFYRDWRKRIARNYAPPRRGVWGPLLPYTYKHRPQVPNPNLLSINGGRTYIGHPETIRKLEEKLG